MAQLTNKKFFKKSGVPNPVINCTIFNHTDMGIEIMCTPGYDGGLPQVFILEMFSSITGMVRYVKKQMLSVKKQKFNFNFIMQIQSNQY